MTIEVVFYTKILLCVSILPINSDCSWLLSRLKHYGSVYGCMAATLYCDKLWDCSLAGWETHIPAFSQSYLFYYISIRSPLSVKCKASCGGKQIHVVVTRVTNINIFMLTYHDVFLSEVYKII